MLTHFGRLVGAPPAAARNPAPTRAAPARSGSRAAALAPEARRASIIAATRTLLIAHGAAVTTRQIAEAAGIAEGTIFRVFADKDSLLRAVVEAATDAGPVERALAAIDRTLPLDQQLVAAVAILQARLRDIWQLAAAAGMPTGPPKGRTAPTCAGLTALFAADPDRITCSPAYASQSLRALTLAMTHPAIAPGRPAKAADVVSLFLDGVRARKGGRPC